MYRKILPILMAGILTARMGTITFDGHKETWYDRPMNRVVTRAQNMGIPCEYWVREDGVKMFGQWVIVAGHKDTVRYTIVNTSLGEGIILDKHCVNDPNLYDIATNWNQYIK